MYIMIQLWHTSLLIYLIFCYVSIYIAKEENSKFDKNASEKVKSDTIKKDKIILSSLLKVCNFLLSFLYNLM